MDCPGQSVHGTENSIWEEIQHLTDRGRKLHIQWVPGHAGLEFNEQVDEIAKRASEEPQDEAEVPLEAAISAINRTVHREWRESVLSTSESTPNSTLGWYLKCERRTKLDHGDTVKRKESRIIEQLRMGRVPF